jgi:hypothetical protein
LRLSSAATAAAMTECHCRRRCIIVLITGDQYGDRAADREERSGLSALELGGKPASLAPEG